MQGSSSFPHGWSEVLPYILAALIGALTRWIPFWQNRKKPEADVGESIARARRTDAETRKLDAEAGKTFGEVVVAFSTKLTEANQEIVEQRERHAKQIEFLQSQIEIKTESEYVSRQRTHRAIAEVQRCIIKIRDYEEMMRTSPGIVFTPFDFKPYEEIMGDTHTEP